MRAPKYIFCFICLMISRLMNILFAVYIQLWVMSFYKQGVLADRDESDSVYFRIVLGIQIATIILLPVFGILTDRADLRYIIPIAFLVRGLVACSFKTIEDPRTT